MNKLLHFGAGLRLIEAPPRDPPNIAAQDGGLQRTGCAVADPENAESAKVYFYTPGFGSILNMHPLDLSGTPGQTRENLAQKRPLDG